MIKAGKETTKKTVKLATKVNDHLVGVYKKVTPSLEKEAETIKKSITSCQLSVDNYERDKQSYIKKKLQQFKKLKEVEENIKQQDGGDVTKGLFKKQFSNLASNKFIKSINFYKDFENKTEYSGFYSLKDTLVIQTKNLDYTGKVHNFDLGGYIIFLTVNDGGIGDLQVFNTKYKRTSYHHPCISSGNVCWGTYSAQKDQARKQMSIDGLIFLLINFLRKPDYDSPHLGEDEYRDSRRKLKIKPEHETEFINSSFREKC